MGFIYWVDGLKNTLSKIVRVSSLVVCTLVFASVVFDWIQSHSRYEQKTPKVNSSIPRGVYRAHIGSARYLYYASRPGMLSVGYMRLKLLEISTVDNLWIDWSCIPLKSLENKSIVFNLWNIFAIQKQIGICTSHIESRSLYMRHWLACLLLGIWPTLVFIIRPIRRLVSSTYYFPL